MNKTYIIHATNFCFMVVMKKNGGRLKMMDCPVVLSKDKVYLVQPCLHSRMNSYLIVHI